MTRYLELMGKCVEVQYRAGDVALPATARLVADSGKSIFLEEHFHRDNKTRLFRWEIPYASILYINECGLQATVHIDRSQSPFLTSNFRLQALS